MYIKNSLSVQAFQSDYSILGRRSRCAYLDGFSKCCCVFESPNVPSDFWAVDICVIIDECKICKTTVENGPQINSLHKSLMKTAHFLDQR